MKHKSLFKLVAGVILAVSVATIPVVCFTEPALAASRKKKTKKAKVKPKKYVSTYEKAMDEAAQEFIRREKIPKSVVRAGEIFPIRSYMAQFKAIRGEGAAIYSQPNFNSKVIQRLNNGAKVIADVEYTNQYGGDWYYVHYGKKAKGWVATDYIINREPDENE